MRVDSCSSPSAPASPQSTGVIAGAVHASRLDVTITTRDGDTATIAASQTMAIGAAATGDSDGRRAALVGSTSSSLSVSVDGSLGHDELVDLKKVLKVLDHAARRLDAQRLVHRLTRPDLDSLTSIAANGETSATVVLASAVATTALAP
jgi:hypothetical protein